MVKLDLGCGRSKKKGFVGIDNCHSWKGQGFKDPKDMAKVIDKVYDLNKNIPFDDGVVEEVYTAHFIEHVVDPIFFLGEIYRVLKVGGVAVIVYPIMLPDVTHLTLMEECWIEKHIGEMFEVLDKEVISKTSHSYNGDERTYRQTTIRLKKNG